MSVHRLAFGRRSSLPWLGLALLAASPQLASALPLLDGELSLDRPRPVVIAEAKAAPKDPSLDFDLLGKPPPQEKVDDATMKRRRWMLQAHQAVGLGLLGLQLATTVVGQLNYTDKYGSNAPVTGKYELTHTVLAYSTLAVFAVDGALALFAPGAPKKREGFDRVTIHWIGMAVATAGMVAQGVTGIYADQREGYQNQKQAAQAHLIIGYVTLAAVGVAVGALVF